ncbi:hypothetical protein Tco_0431383 [Tanacetum coccineum]
MVSWHLGPPPELVHGELGSLGVALDWVLLMLPLYCSASKLVEVVAALSKLSSISSLTALSATLSWAHGESQLARHTYHHTTQCSDLLTDEESQDEEAFAWGLVRWVNGDTRSTQDSNTIWVAEGRRIDDERLARSTCSGSLLYTEQREGGGGDLWDRNCVRIGWIGSVVGVKYAHFTEQTTHLVAECGLDYIRIDGQGG